MLSSIRTRHNDQGTKQTALPVVVERGSTEQIKVVLNKEEILFAKKTAKERNLENRSNRNPDGKVLEDSLMVDIQGALAEYAVSKGLMVAWEGRFINFAEWQRDKNVITDVAGYEVRSTRHMNGRLLLHPSDKDNVPYILVTSLNETEHYLVGWCFGKDGKKEEYWADIGYGRPCYFVPRDSLKPISQLVGS